MLTETRCRSKSTHDKQSVSVGSKYVVDRDTYAVSVSRLCWVITRYLCGLSIFCWISWFWLRQQVFAYSAMFCWVIIRHFDNSASFCWHTVFLLNQLISLTCQIFADTSYFLLSHHHVFVLFNEILLTQHILLNQLILAETASFCLLSYVLLSHHQAFW